MRNFNDYDARRPMNTRREGGRPGMGGEFRPLPEMRGEYGRFETLPEDAEHRGHCRTLPENGGERGHFETLPGRFDGEPRPMPHHGEDMDGPRSFGPDDGRDMPHRFGPRGEGPGIPGGRRPFGGGMGPGRPGFPPHGMPPRPDPDILRERIEESGLAELLDMAGRMARHRPDAGPARGQNLILSILAGREALSQRELQQMLGVQPGSLSEILTKLERKGLITREKAEDRRGNLLRVTDAGRQAMTEPDPSSEDALFAALTPEEQDSLRALLQKLLEDWAEKADRMPRAPRSPAPGRFVPLSGGGEDNKPRNV